MILNEAMQGAINEQINNELFAMYSYLSMSAYLEHKQFRGCAHWMRLQSQEEHIHAMRLYDFLIARQGRDKLLTIA
jgi:ferritin